MSEGKISERSRRVARNTLLLYLRMLLLLVIGLFTSRLVLQALGEQDYGTYNAVYGMVMMFTLLSGSMSNAISRYMAFELGAAGGSGSGSAGASSSDSADSGSAGASSSDAAAGGGDRLRKLFCSAILIQLALVLLLALLVPTLGEWYLSTRMVIPEGSLGKARLVMYASALLLAIQLFSIPYNAVIISREKMKVFAYISVLEAALKLAVAFYLLYTPYDKLICYALCMPAVALLIRSTYAIHCRRSYPECRGAVKIDMGAVRGILGLGGWSFAAGAASTMNTHGLGILSNRFFGVGVNASRAIATQVEGIIKQFVSNFLTALNPQITKSWAEGNRDYCFALVAKGCKFSSLIILAFAVPFAFEAQTLLELWLGDVVPEGAALFTSLSLFCLLADMGANSIFQLVLSTGRVARYYIVTSLISLLAYILAYISFALGGQAHNAYLSYLGVYLICDLVKLLLARGLTGLSLRPFFKEVVLPCLGVGLASALFALVPWLLLGGGSGFGSGFGSCFGSGFGSGAGSGACFGSGAGSFVGSVASIADGLGVASAAGACFASGAGSVADSVAGLAGGSVLPPLASAAIVCISSLIGFGLSTWLLALTPGEKSWLLSLLKKAGLFNLLKKASRKH